MFIISETLIGEELQMYRPEASGLSYVKRRASATSRTSTRFLILFSTVSCSPAKEKYSHFYRNITISLNKFGDCRQLDRKGMNVFCAIG